MRSLETTLEGTLLLEPAVHRDSRGFFLESYRANAFADFGLPEFVQHNHSRSARGVVRGMHFQAGMAKLVRCARGEILDVVVDLRRGSASFSRWEAHKLDDSSHRQLYIPDGFAHGFCVVSDEADVLYSCSAYYDPTLDTGFRYDDPDVGIPWPRELELTISERDRGAPLLRELDLSALG